MSSGTLLLAVRRCDISNRTHTQILNVPFTLQRLSEGWRGVCALSCPAEGPRRPTIEEFLHCCHSCSGQPIAAGGKAENRCAVCRPTYYLHWEFAGCSSSDSVFCVMNLPLLDSVPEVTPHS